VERIDELMEVIEEAYSEIRQGLKISDD